QPDMDQRARKNLSGAVFRCFGQLDHAAARRARRRRSDDANDPDAAESGATAALRAHLGERLALKLALGHSKPSASSPARAVFYFPAGPFRGRRTRSKAVPALSFRSA